MSNAAESHDSHGAAASGHGAGHGGADHVPHVTPYSTYFGVWIALVIFTVITVVASRIDFGDGNLIIAMIIATTKATLVALFFMHLLHDQKFHGIILVSSLIFLGIFIGLTGSDLFARGRADGIEARHPMNSGDPWGGMKPIATHAAHHGGAEHAAAPAGEHAAAPAGEHAAAPAGEHAAAPAGEHVSPAAAVPAGEHAAPAPAPAVPAAH